MMPDDINAIPFHAIAEGLSASQHSRRMTGSLLALFPNITDKAYVASMCMSPEFAEAVVCTDDNFIHVETARRGLLTAQQANKYADMLAGFSELDLGTPRFKAALLALGSPLLGHRAVALAKQYAGVKDGQALLFSIENALLGNPLVHGNGNFSDPHPSQMDIFLENAAIYGNLENSKIADLLCTKLKTPMEVLQDGASYCPGGVEVVREALLLRRELPDSLVFALDDAPTAEPETHRKLVEFSAHKKLATQKEVRPFRLFLSMKDSGEWVVSPVVTPEEISVRTGVFRVGGVGDSQRLSLLLARQCPMEVYRSLREENWAFCETIDFLRFSPWAAESIREHGNTADFVKRGVKMAGRESDLRFICLPCIPFDDVRAKDLREAFGSRTPTHIAATIAAMCRSRSFAEETSLDGSSFDVAHLFAAATSTPIITMNIFRVQVSQIFPDGA